MALAPAVLGPAQTEGRVLYTNVITCLVLGVNTTGTEHLSELHLETIYKTPKVMKAVVFFFFTCLKKRGVSTAANQTLHRDQKVLAKIYGLSYGAKTYLFIQLPY